MITLLEILQKKLSGKTTESLSPQDVIRLFAHPPGPLLNLYIYRALKTKSIDPDTVLLSAIGSSQGINLPAVAFSLRMGANPNLYVNDPKNGGPIHLMGYIFRLFGKQKPSEIFAELIVILLLRGSDPSKPIFDPLAGKIRKDKPEEHLFPPEMMAKLIVSDQPDYSTTPISQPTVLEWLNIEGYPTGIFDDVSFGDSAIANLNPPHVRKLALLLNNPQLVITSPKGIVFTEADMWMAIEFFSHDCYEKIPLSQEKQTLDYLTIDRAISHYNYDAFMNFLSRGQEPSYLCMNTLLYGIIYPPDRSTGEVNYSLVAEVYEKILSKAIEIGIQLDVKQYGLLEMARGDIQKNLKAKYDQPYWEKTCSYQASPKVPRALSRLALSLNIDPFDSKRNICEVIRKTKGYDPTVIKEAAHKKRKAAIDGKLLDATEFTSSSLPEIMISNGSFLKNGVLDYNEYEIVVYRDSQGFYRAFTSDQFSGLIEAKRNPTTGLQLPDSVIKEMSEKLEMLKKLGINAEYPFRTPKTISEAVSELSQPDTQNQVDGLIYYAHLINRAARYGFSSEMITRLSPEQLQNALTTMGINVDFSRYSREHALITTAFILEERTDISPFLNRISILGTETSVEPNRESNRNP